MRVKIVSAGLFSIVLALAAGCSSGGGSDTLNLSQGGSTTIVAKGGTTPHFDPKVIEVPRGKEVTFMFKNDDDKPHDFTVSYIGVQVTAEAGQTVPVTLTAPDKGTLRFYDSNHWGDGMFGEIRVV